MGGYRAFRGRLGKDWSLNESRHSSAARNVVYRHFAIPALVASGGLPSSRQDDSDSLFLLLLRTCYTPSESGVMS